MPRINIGQNCGVLGGPTSVTPLGTTESYYSLTSSSAKKMISINSTGTIDFCDFNSSGVTGIPNDYLLYMAWDPNIQVSGPASTPTGKSPMLTGDFRFRYVFSASQKPNDGTAPPYSPSTSIVVYLSNPDSVDSAQIIYPDSKVSAKLKAAIANSSYVPEATNGIMIYKKTTPGLPGIATGLSSYFVNATYVPPGPKPMLTASGTEIDVNKPYADISKVVKIPLSQTVKDATSFQITPILQSGGPVVSTSLSISGGGISGSFSLPNGKTYLPLADSSAGNDPETVTSEERKSTIFNMYSAGAAGTLTGVLGWAITNGTYGLTTKSSYFSYATIGANQGYFNLVGLGVGDFTTETNQFLLLSADNSKMFIVSGSNITTLPSPIGSTGALSPSLNTLGGWSTEASTLAPGRFYLKYQGPAPSSTGATAPVPQYLLSTTTVSSLSSLGATFTCTDCTPVNGTCTMSTVVRSGPAIGTYNGDFGIQLIIIDSVNGYFVNVSGVRTVFTYNLVPGSSNQISINGGIYTYTPTTITNTSSGAGFTLAGTTTGTSTGTSTGTTRPSDGTYRASSTEIITISGTSFGLYDILMPENNINSEFSVSGNTFFVNGIQYTFDSTTLRTPTKTYTKS